MQGITPCSADTILQTIKELAVPTEEVTSEAGVDHWLNKLMLKALRATGQLDSSGEYTLDYDNSILATEKYDAQPTYKHGTGYAPGVATIGEHIVYIEGRGGNSPATYCQAQTLQRAFGLLSEQGIPIARFRADSASYQGEVVEEVAAHSDSFYIRAKRSAGMAEHVRALPESAWSSHRVGIQSMEVDDWRPFDGQTAYRLVVSRIKRSNAQGELFNEDNYRWRAILTNDTQWTPERIIGFYNQRGSAERTFDIMGNDFGWKRLPCSFLRENTAFMILTALYQKFYHYVLATFSAKLDWLAPTFRLKKFIFRFISVPAKWIKTGREHILKLYGVTDYSPLGC